MPDLFDTPPSRIEDSSRPLADRLRPQSLNDVVGQGHLLAPDAPLGRMLAQKRLSSLILWGPPGVGKTTIARLLAQAVGMRFEQISAIFSGVAELRKVFDTAAMRGGQTLLFVDEIHRFNRSQQDSFLPHMESGLIVLVGATTENPSFALNAALLSRAQVLVLRRLDAAALADLLRRAEVMIRRQLPLTPAARETLLTMADGDGRALLGMVEVLASLPPATAPLEPSALGPLLARRAPVYDRDREGHYGLISALHKSVRGSDADAALYWFARMLDGGEEPLFIARRLVRMAVEDIGLADPQALEQALAAKAAYEFLGSPEGELALAQAVIYLATAPKSNAGYVAYKAALQSARENGSLPPPPHILNAPTKLMKQQGYGAGYEYDHDQPDAFSGQSYFPEGMGRARWYKPTPRGFEAELKRRIEYWDELRARKQRR